MWVGVPAPEFKNALQLELDNLHSKSHTKISGFTVYGATRYEKLLGFQDNYFSILTLLSTENLPMLHPF